MAPAMVLDGGVWDDEIERWAPGIDATQVAYTSLVERDCRRPTKTLTEQVASRRWGTAIADESHHLKSRGKQEAYWTSAIRKGLKTECFRQATGTPIPNWAYEAFNSLQFAYPEEAKPRHKFGSYWRWAEKWFCVGPRVDRAGRVLVPKAVHGFRDTEHLAGCPVCQMKKLPARTWEEFRAENWGDRMLMRLRDNCLDLPPLTFQQWKVRMKGPQAKAYRALKKDFIAWLDSGAEIVAWNEAAQSVKLAQCATGLEVLDGGAKGSAKLEALKTLLKDRPRPTLVVGYFKSTVEACARAAREIGAEAEIIHGSVGRRERRERSRAFKKGNLQVMCATIDTIHEGLTYTAADQVIRVERSWVPSRNESVAQRLHRIGQTRPVLVIDLITEGTVDQRQLRVVDEKSDQEIKALGKDELRRLVE